MHNMNKWHFLKTLKFSFGVTLGLLRGYDILYVYGYVCMYIRVGLAVCTLHFIILYNTSLYFVHVDMNIVEACYIIPGYTTQIKCHAHLFQFLKIVNFAIDFHIL